MSVFISDTDKAQLYVQITSKSLSMNHFKVQSAVSLKC